MNNAALVPHSSSPPLPLVSLRPVLWVLIATTLFCAVLTLLRTSITGTPKLNGFFGNLLLAWIPLLLSLFLQSAFYRHDWRRRSFWPVGALWLLFYPNCFYIVTDFIHMKTFGTGGMSKWFDLLMTSSYALAGVYLGCLSLFVLHLLVRQRLGSARGWQFVFSILTLSTIGIYIGRFWRLNSWDVLRPLRLWEKILVHFKSSIPTVSFLLIMFFISVSAYLFFYTSTGLQRGKRVQREQ